MSDCSGETLLWALIYDALRAKGWIIPQTEEDVARQERAMDARPAPKEARHA